MRTDVARRWALAGMLVAGQVWAQRPITVDDIVDLENVGAVAMSPDGGHVLYALSAWEHPAAKDTSKGDRHDLRSHVWVVRSDGGEPRQLTFGERGESSPQWSPDGRSRTFRALIEEWRPNADGMYPRSLRNIHLVLYDVASRAATDVATRDCARLTQCSMVRAPSYSKDGTTDIPRYIGTFYDGMPQLDGTLSNKSLELYRSRSAVTYSDKVVTPLLMLHGGNDERVPIGQPMEYFRSLKDRGKAVELVFYPRERDGLGEYNHQIDKIERDNEWLTRFTLGSRVLQ